MERSKLICFQFTQNTEHLKRKQGHLLMATRSTGQIRKLIFLSQVLENISTQTISYTSALLYCCVSPFAFEKTQSIGPFPGVATLP